MNLIKNGNTYYLSKVNNIYYGVSDYLIDNGQLKWANDKVYLECPGGDNNSYITTNIYYDEISRYEVLMDRYRDEQNGGPVGLIENNTGYIVNTYYYLTTEASYRSLCIDMPNASTCIYDISAAEVTSLFGNGIYINFEKPTTSSCVCTFNNSKTISLSNLANPHVKLSLISGWKNGVYDCYQDRRIRYIKFYNLQSQLVGHFVPVPTGLVIGSYTVPSNGMFDIVNQQFYPNQGSGTFSYGKEV